MELTPVLFGVVPGVLVGALLWWRFVRPQQLDNYERQRRQGALPPRRTLPEDRR